MPQKGRHMQRSLPEYKAEMQEIRKKVNLAKRSDLYQKLRAALLGRHQDTLDRNYVIALEANYGDSSIAEKKAIQTVFDAIFQTLKTSKKGRTREFYRSVTVMTGISKDILVSKTDDEIISAVKASRIYQ